MGVGLEDRTRIAGPGRPAALVGAEAVANIDSPPCSTGAIVVYMDIIGLRELRQNASEYVRRAEGGESLLVSVSGRTVAALVPAPGRTWRRWDDVAELFAGPADPDWDADRDLVDQTIRDPWEGR